MKGCPTAALNFPVELANLSNNYGIFTFLAKSFQGISFLLKRGVFGFLSF